MKTLVITASNNSGLSCGYAAWNNLRYSSEYIALDYGQELPDLTGIEMLYILSYSLTKKQLEYLSNMCIAVVIIDDKNIKTYNEFINSDNKIKADDNDNHETKRHITIGTIIKKSDNEIHNPVRFDSSIEFIIDTTKSSISSCWEYFNTNPVLPKLLKYIEDYNTWKFQYKESKRLNYALNSINSKVDYSYWSQLNMSEDLLNYILQKGQAIEEYFNTINTKFINNEDNLFYTNIGEHKIVLLTLTRANDINELADLILYVKEDVDFVIGFNLLGNDNSFKVSLRSRVNEVDVSEIARRFGGGGKPTTAGFILNKKDLNPNEIINEIIETISLK